MSGGLFELPPESKPPDGSAPLAERLRPTSLDEVLGQESLAPGSLLRSLLDAGRVPSLILWGPPGCGKTTIARLLADQTNLRFLPFSAVLGGVKELRERIDEARHFLRAGSRALLFVDEIHHFSRSQQDALLPHVESGLVTLVGATTENPSFHVNAALLSRCTVVPLHGVPDVVLGRIAENALTDPERGLGVYGIQLDAITLASLIATSHGDARSMLNRLEALVVAASAYGRDRRVPLEEAARLLADKKLAHDRKGDSHYDLASAFQKSIRGGDPQASLYWLARMLEGGEDPLFIARRLVRTASEDIGLADPQALRIALDALEAFRFLGTPEGELSLAVATTYLATAPKSASVYAALKNIREEIQRGAADPVPNHLRNAPTALAKSLGHGDGYQYPHDLPHAVSEQEYLPDRLTTRAWYQPSPFGHEKEVAKRMAWWSDLRRRLREEGQTQPMDNDRTQFLKDVAHEAGEIISRHFGRITEVGRKGVRDLVTIADREAEALVIERIRAAFPGEDILAEETLSTQTMTDRIWILDPLDGTTNFVHRIPHVAVSLAYWENFEPLAACVLNPILGECFTAAAGQGAYLGSTRLRVSSTAELKEALLATGFHYRMEQKDDDNLQHFVHLARQVRGLRRLGSAALDLCYVADGRYDGFWELHLSPWDVAAGGLIVREAGGVVTDFRGGRQWLMGGSIVASNPALYRTFADEINRPLG